MPTKRLERLLFVQGDHCFFCKSPLPKTEASIEHLFASANGGGNNEENCVACCKSLNAILGSMSLKDKFQVVLNQKGNFKCPNGVGAAGKAANVAIIKTKSPPVTLAKEPVSSPPTPDNFSLVVANLKNRDKGRPRTLMALTRTVAAIFPKGITEAELATLIQKLQSTSKIAIDEGKVSYTL